MPQTSSGGVTKQLQPARQKTAFNGLPWPVPPTGRILTSSSVKLNFLIKALGPAHSQRYRTAGGFKRKEHCRKSPCGRPRLSACQGFDQKIQLQEDEVRIRPVGGTGQVEPLNAVFAGLAEALGHPPLDVRGARNGLNLVYRLNDLGLPAVYSSIHTNTKLLKERPGLAQKWIAALAESIYFVEKNPDKNRVAVAKTLKLNDPEALQSAYEAYAKLLVNRRMIVPESTVAE